jgi:glucose/mannose transport system permease protein
MRKLRASRLLAILAFSPAYAIFYIVFLGGMAWTIYMSFTASRMLPNYTNFVGFSQYEALFSSERWMVALQNLLVWFGPLMVGASLALGVLMAILLDQKVRGEGAFRFIILVPYSTSFIVTGLAWRWLLDPGLGIPGLVRSMGYTDFVGDWIVRADTAIFTLVIAGVWHASGLVMVIVLASLRSVNDEIWKAAAVDGIPKWRTYQSIVIPMLAPALASAFVLLSISVVKVYDLVVAMTEGGPGFASDMPATFVMDNLFERQNIGLATAGATVMLITVISIIGPWMLYQNYKKNRAVGATG